MIFRLSIAYLMLCLGITLTGINIYGLNKDIRPTGISDKHVIFQNRNQHNYQEALKLVQIKEGETQKEYAARLTPVIAESIAHIHWNKYDPKKFNQTIPIWENYFIYFMAVFTEIPELERYHFANYERSLERGIGVCGDASMIMSQLLLKNGIKSKIVSFPAHVLVEAEFSDGDRLSLDPDFGVVLPYSVKDINQNPNVITDYYQELYSAEETSQLVSVLGDNYKMWGGVREFIRKRYYFEMASYALKWPFPIALILASLYFIYSDKKRL